jgi:hypothetical protein
VLEGIACLPSELGDCANGKKLPLPTKRAIMIAATPAMDTPIMSPFPGLVWPGTGL